MIMIRGEEFGAFLLVEFWEQQFDWIIYPVHRVDCRFKTFDLFLTQSRGRKSNT